MTRVAHIRAAPLAARGAACAISLLVALPLAAQTVAFDIPAEDAITSIPEFARQAGLQIIAPADQLRGIRTSAVQGAMDVHAALRKLLHDTGLIVTSDDGRTI